MEQPSQEELLKAYQAVQKKRQYNAAYMARYRVEHREEWNKQQRERYAKKKSQKTIPSTLKLLKDNVTLTYINSGDTHEEEKETC